MCILFRSQLIYKNIYICLFTAKTFYIGNLDSVIKWGVLSVKPIFQYCVQELHFTHIIQAEWAL